MRKALDEGNTSCRVSVSLQKAFVFVNHQILLPAKLHHTGYMICRVSNDWFKSSAKLQSICIHKWLLHGYHRYLLKILESRLFQDFVRNTLETIYFWGQCPRKSWKKLCSQQLWTLNFGCFIVWGGWVWVNCLKTMEQLFYFGGRQINGTYTKISIQKG